MHNTLSIINKLHTLSMSKTIKMNMLIKANLFNRKAIREMLKCGIVYGMKIKFHENCYWFSSLFTICLDGLVGDIIYFLKNLNKLEYNNLSSEF
jgi:hypothetical protein